MFFRLLVTIVLFFSGECVAESGTLRPIRVGAVASLTGGAADLGKDWLAGVQAGIDELKSEGIAVELIIENDASTTGGMVGSFQKLARVDKVDFIIGGTFDYLAEAAYPLAAQLRMPFVTVTNPVEILSKEAIANPYVFSNGLRIGAERNAIEAFFKSRAIKKIALVYADIPFGVSHAEMMREICREAGIAIVYENKFPLSGYPDTIKLSALKISVGKPDLVYVTFDYNGLDLILTEFERLKINAALLNTQHLGAALTLSKNPEKFKETYGVYARLGGESHEKFRAKYALHPAGGTAEGYDAVLFGVKVLAGGKKLARDEQFELSGVTGVHRLPSADGSLVHNEAVVVTIRNGELVPYEGASHS